MGVAGRLAGERALDLSVEESESPQAFERLAEVATQLRDADGADVIVLGCAGMARHRSKLQSTLGLKVVDPVQAAAGQAVAAVLLMPPEPLYATQTVAGERNAG
jgi:Asp/Glu/hydantoin racemase